MRFRNEGQQLTQMKHNKNVLTVHTRTIFVRNLLLLTGFKLSKLFFFGILLRHFRPHFTVEEVVDTLIY